jgi:hypothetical protein
MRPTGHGLAMAAFDGTESRLGLDIPSAKKLQKKLDVHHIQIQIWQENSLK